jgi:hypothetical protein
MLNIISNFRQMKVEIIPHIEAIASIMKMTRVNDEFYYGEHKTLFRATNFGFVLSTVDDYANPKHPYYISRSYSMDKSNCFFTPVTDTRLGIYKGKKS